MNYILQLLLFVLLMRLFLAKRSEKMGILFFGMMTCSIVKFSFVPTLSSLNLFCLVFVISEIPFLKDYYRKLDSSFFKIMIVVNAVGFLCLLYGSPHYKDSIGHMLKLFVREMLCYDFIVYYSFVSMKDSKSWNYLLKMVYYGVLLLSVAGVINLITKHGFFVDMAMGGGQELNSSTELLGAKYAGEKRFRVQSLYFNPFDYGFMCLSVLILYAYAFFQKIVDKRRFVIIFSCCLFGIVFCGCRTILLSSVFGFILFVLLTFSLKRKVKIFFVFLLLGAMAYLFVPPVVELVDSALSVFEMNSQVEGSSLEMRMKQYARVFYYIKNNLLLGRGKDFFLIDLGWKGGLESLVDRELMGLEGIMMSLLLERGVVGVIVWSLFYGLIAGFCLKHRKRAPIASSACLTLIAVYVIFVNMTGELNSFFPTLLLSGCFINSLVEKRNNIVNGIKK